MNRERKAADLYESTKAITDRDAFQLVISGEPDDYVLADLRKMFWDGKGDKPWQVVEIHRLLTRRKEVRVSPGAQETTKASTEKTPSLKERIENNLVVFFLTILVAGFLAGVGAYQGVLKIVDYTSVSNE